MSASPAVVPAMLEAQLTGKAKQLEEEHAKGMTEAERLRDEVNRSRALRANRAATRSQKSISSMSGVASPSSPMTSPPLGTVKVGNSIGGTASPASSTSTPRFQPAQTIKTTASSFPVFAGRTASGGEASSNGASLSLANFIGGDSRVKGPVLNRVRPHEEEALLTPEERTKPQATFLSKNPALLPQRAKSPAVALPGMTRPGQSYSGSGSSQSKVEKSPIIKSTSFEAKTPPAVTTSSTTPSTKSYGSKSPLLDPSAEGNSSMLAIDRNLSKSPGPMDKLSLSDEASSAVGKHASSSTQKTNAPASAMRPIHTFGSPSLPAKFDLDEASSPSSDSTPSLTRLKGSNLVKQRLQWGEAQNSSSGPSGFGSANSSARSSPANSPKPQTTSIFTSSGEQVKSSNTSQPQLPSQDASAPPSAVPITGKASSTSDTPVQTKRTSVLDRWNRDTPDSKGASLPASPQASPKPEQSKWPKPAYAKPTLATKQSWSSATTASGSKSTKADVSQSNVPKSDQEENVQAGKATEPTAATQISTVSEPVAREQPKPYQRPSTKPPWMAKEQEHGMSKSIEPLRTTSFPKPELPTSTTAARSPIPVPHSSKSLPSHNLPISVSPVPYTRSPASPGPSRSGPTSPRTGVFQPQGTSFPVSLGMAPTHARPLSLAHFIGGDKHINGPVLNKVRPEDTESYGLETDASAGPKAKVGSFLTHNPGVVDEMMRKHKVAMPGMVKATSPNPQSQIMEKKGSTGSLPLPGLESPKLPLPGEFAPASTDESHRTGEDFGKSQFDDTYDAKSVLPSESHTPLEAVYPSARAISHDSTKHHDNDHAETLSRPSDTSQPNSATSEDNPWASIGSAMLVDGDETIRPPKPKAHKSMPSWEGTLSRLGNGPARHAPLPPKGQVAANSASGGSRKQVKVQRKAVQPDDYPSIDVSKLKPKLASIGPIRYLSVDVLSISDTSKLAAIPTVEQHIFYSTELLTIILRHKEGGLVTTQLFVWKGKHCSEDGRDNIAELETRYRSQSTYIEQGREPVQLLKALGGRLTTRQGFRASFDILNTTLYRVQTRGRGLAFIDEVELQSSSLCSAYSYVASVFQDLFVWYGRGSPDEESRVALQYAEMLSKAGPGAKRKVVHMLEGSESELWNDIMGHGEDYASANHWRFRLEFPLLAEVQTQFYEVDPSSRLSPVRPIGDESTCRLEEGKVYIMRTALECFVVVTPAARGDASNIGLAMTAAVALLKQSSGFEAPFRPTLHALILPSLVPRDLQASLRSALFDDLNAPYHPTTMNVLDEETAWQHLMRENFREDELEDIALLPLGVSPDMLR